MSTVERFLELKNKVATSGLTVKEAQELQRLGQVVTQQDVAAFHELQQQRSDNAVQRYLTRIYREARSNNGQVLRQCQANEEAIRELHMPVDLFLGAVKRDDFAKIFVWVDSPTDKQAEQRDRAAFTAFVKENRYADNAANFNLAREILGYGNITEYGLIQAVQSNALRLAPATAEELAEREREAAAQRAEQLKSMDKVDLRKAVNEDYQCHRHAAQAAEASRVLEAKRKAEAEMNLPPIPDWFQGQRVDQKFFKTCSRETMRYFLQRYGEFQVTQKIRGN